MNPTVRGFIIILAITGLVVALSLYSTLAALYLIARLRSSSRSHSSSSWCGGSAAARSASGRPVRASSSTRRRSWCGEPGHLYLEGNHTAPTRSPSSSFSPSASSPCGACGRSEHRYSQQSVLARLIVLLEPNQLANDARGARARRPGRPHQRARARLPVQTAADGGPGMSCLVIALAVFAPLVVSHGPNTQDLSHPSPARQPRTFSAPTISAETCSAVCSMAPGSPSVCQL